MRKNLVLFLTVFVLGISVLNAQNEEKGATIFAGVDLGLYHFSNNLRSDVDFIRNQVNSYHFDHDGYSNYSSKVNSYFFSSAFSAKASYFTLKNYAELGVGLRFSKYLTYIGDESGNQYFYFKASESGLTTNYYRIYSINQDFTNISIPLEIKLYPYQASFVRLYFKFSSEFVFTINENREVKFVDDDMDKYKNEVWSKFADPNPFKVMLMPSLGLRFCKDNKYVAISGEIGMPFFVQENQFSLVEVDNGFNFQLNVSMPINAVKK